MPDFLPKRTVQTVFSQDSSKEAGLVVAVNDLPEKQRLHAELALVAVQVAHAAAQRIADMRASIDNMQAHTSAKSALEDPVTIVDREAESLIRQRLTALRPADGIVGEEGTQIASNSGVTWIVDPIDGTVNFIYGIPQYAVSVAAAIDGVVVAGAVKNVATGTLWLAGAGIGSYRLDSAGLSRLAASAESSLQLSLVATGFGYNADRRKAQAEILVNILPRVRDIRRQGSAALDLCAVADGTVEAYYEHGINAWDFAAGAVIAAQAGAYVATPELTDSGTAGLLCFAAAPQVSEEFAQLMAEVPEALTA